MDIKIVQPEELTADQKEVWCRMMGPEKGTDSPFFHPDYLVLLGNFRKSVRVAIIKENSSLVGFFPFERHGEVGRPPGIKLTDFQGIISHSGNPIDTRKLLTGCNLVCHHFDHIVACQPLFQKYHYKVEDSLYMDLSRGYENYVAENKKSGSKLISRLSRFKRKLEREIGPSRFTWNSTDEQDFQTLLRLKSAQRKQTRTFDILQFEWVKAFLNQIRKMDSPDFGGVLSTLHVQDRLVAVHLGIRTKDVLHYWFPAYEYEFSKYSPGLLLHLAFTKAAAESGIIRIDLGKGDDFHKKGLGSGSIPVALGAVDRSSFRHHGRKLWFRMREQLRNSPLRGPVQIPKRIIRDFTQKRTMQ